MFKSRKTPELDDLKKGLKANTVEGLIYALRHKETWPEGFRWNFASCHTCAMGLRYELWGAPNKERRPTTGFAWIDNTVDALNMNRDAAMVIFGTVECYASAPLNRITPEMVADKLEAYAACVKRHEKEIDLAPEEAEENA